MALNDNYNIANLPSINIARSKFDKSHSHKTTFNVGDFVPIFIDELPPGSTLSLATNKLVRLQTLLYPLMDNVYLDCYYFFVPCRLLWSHWKEFMGENTQTSWYPQVTYTVPQIVCGALGFDVNSVADHFGIPLYCDRLEVNALPFRAYALIWNEYFRDENLSDPINIYFGDNDVSAAYASDSFNYINDGYKGLDMLKVAKYRDLFTTALPAPQKGPQVALSNPILGNAMVIHTSQPNTQQTNYPSTLIPNTGLKWNLPTNKQLADIKYIGTSGTFATWDHSDPSENMNSDELAADYENLYPTNLVALSGHFNNSVSPSADYKGALRMAVPINELRLAFATQRLLERDARYGTRYTEILTGHFGITSPDARLQRPEFIGGSHIALNIDQVVETAGTTAAGNILGETGAYSVTADSSDDVVGYSTLEHGYVIGVCCVRYEHSYQQGLEKLWSRSDRLSFFWPELSNIGEVGILNKEIFVENPGDTDVPISETDRDDVFGYQEAWYEYRNKKNYVTGEMRSNISNSLDAWHLADDYNETPTLGHAWILEDKSNVDRVLAVTSAVSNQVLADFYFDYQVVEPLPTYSVPGLIDMR